MKWLRRILIGLVGALLIIAILGGFIVYQAANGPLPQHSGTISLAGLDGEVTIIRDTWGIPHIYASTVHDLRFAQGYVQAQDRWWQMEFSRHTGHGSLQELTGQTDSLMGTDVFIRTVGWTRAAQNDLDNLPPEAVAELQAFSDGVNAYIIPRSANDLAFEYRVLGLTGVNIPIAPWTPIDTLVWTKVMSWDLGGNRGNELFRSELNAALGEEMVANFLPDFGYGTKPTIIWPEEIPESGTFAPAPESDTSGIQGYTTLFAGNVSPDRAFLFGGGDGIGSNNWVVSGEHTASGMPLLANDPHLSIQNPSIWYEIGLHCQPISDGCPYDVRGFTFPASPFVVIGHNARIAWGVTNVGWDTQDLYRMEINPDNPLQYRWNGEWRDMEVVEEEIKFGDGGSRTIQVRVTHLGPIINDNRIDDATGEILGFNNEDPLAFRWAAYEPGTIVQSLILLNKAGNWDEFREALRYWDTPSQNVIYADVDGNIGYQTPSNVPIRAAGHTGKLPVDGTTDEFEWKGYVPYDYLPSIYNPERGYISTANQALVPMEYYGYLANELGDEFGADSHYVFEYEWSYGYRGQRINEMIEATDSHTIETFEAIHGDNKAIIAEELQPYFASLDMGSPEMNEARDWLFNWDYQMHMNSPQAALFGYVWYRLEQNLWEDQLGEIGDVGGGDGNMWAVFQLMEDPENVWWDDVATTDATESRDEILIRSFNEGYTATSTALGANRDEWRWGKLHLATFVSNPLGLSGIGVIEDFVNTGPVETSGGSDMVNATGWTFDGDNPFEVRALPSMRMIVDLGDLSASQTMHTTGQSGHPASPNYSNFVDEWRNINYHPMLFSREEIDANAASTLTLQPQN
jgi:penicillin amidase